MLHDTPNSFLLGPWKIEPLSGSMTGPAGDIQHLEPKVMDVLVCLAVRAHEVVTREELLNFAWDGSVTSDEQLTRAISELRRAFDDNPGNPDYIETVPKRGYRLIQDIRSVEYNIAETGTRVTGPVNRINWRQSRFFGLAVLILPLIYIAADKYLPAPVQEGAVVGDKSIAVLPFVNMREDPGNMYLADGISEDIINLLSAVPDLKVIGRTSSFAFKGKNEDLRVIGQSLGVRTLLEGSVRKSGDNVKIVVQLIDASDGTEIWSSNFDRPLTDIFEVQDIIASSVVNALGVQVTPAPGRNPPTGSAEAYTNFLKARLAINRLAWREALELLNSVLELDPQFAQAHELLSYTYWYAAYNGLDPEVAQRKAYESASAAIAIDPGLIFAQRLCRSIPGEGPSDDIDASEWAYRQQPGNPMVLDSLVYMYTYAGYKEEALRIARHYAELDPLSLDANLDLFAALYSAGQIEEAMQTLDIIDQIGLGPSNWQWFIAGAMLVEGDDEAAIDYFQSLLHLFGYSNLDWVGELVTAARDPETGEAYLDQRIPEIAASLSDEDSYNWKAGLIDWYLYFGFIDRYYELMFAAEPETAIWTDADEHLWNGHVYRQLGFTAHPHYLSFATDRGIVEVWEKRGPPEFCRKMGGTWTCE